MSFYSGYHESMNFANLECTAILKSNKCSTAMSPMELPHFAKVQEEQVRNDDCMNCSKYNLLKVPRGNSLTILEYVAQ